MIPITNLRTNEITYHCKEDIKPYELGGEELYEKFNRNTNDWKYIWNLQPNQFLLKLRDIFRYTYLYNKEYPDEIAALHEATHLFFQQKQTEPLKQAILQFKTKIDDNTFQYYLTENYFKYYGAVRIKGKTYYEGDDIHLWHFIETK